MLAKTSILLLAVIAVAAIAVACGGSIDPESQQVYDQNLKVARTRVALDPGTVCTTSYMNSAC